MLAWHTNGLDNPQKPLSPWDFVTLPEEGRATALGNMHKEIGKNRACGSGDVLADIHTDKPVGFYGPIAPPVPNAPSSECPELRSLHAATPSVQSEYPVERRAAAAVQLPELL